MNTFTIGVPVIPHFNSESTITIRSTIKVNRMLNLTFQISHADFLPLKNADVRSVKWMEERQKAFAFS